MHHVSARDVRLLPDSLLEPVLALPPRDGRALLRRVGVLGGICAMRVFRSRVATRPDAGWTRTSG